MTNDSKDGARVSALLISRRELVLAAAATGGAGILSAGLLPADDRNQGQTALDAGRRQAMSYSISTLLIRNLNDVFGENDPARRRAAIDEIFTADCVFYEPKGVYRGRDEIDRVAGAIKATHPDFRYRPIAGPEELGNSGRIQWYRAALVRREGMPGLTSSLPGTADCRRLSLFDTLPLVGAPERSAPLSASHSARR